MGLPPLHFKIGGRIRWDEAHDGMRFEGHADTGSVAFVATAEALACMLNPDRGHIDAIMCAEVFAEYEADLHRIAQRVYRSRSSHTPILIFREDVQMADRL